MARAGRYRYLVELQQPAASQAGNGEPIDNFSTVASAYAGIEPLRGRESFQAGRVTAETTHLIVMRFDPALAIDETWRVKWGARIFDIEAAINVGERAAELELTAIERKSQE